MVLGSAIAVETPEPVELLRLREQFQSRVEREIEPLRAVYRGELEKLEKRLIKENRLVDALTVKNERESLNKEFAENGVPADAKRPKTSGELEKALADTTWSYIADMPNTGLDVRYVILLAGGKVIFGWNNAVGQWKATAANRVELAYPLGNGTMKMKTSPDLTKWEGTWSLDPIPRTGRRIGAGDPPR